MSDGATLRPAVATLRLRPTMLSDLEFVISVEQDPVNRPYITPWERTQHEGAIRFPDFRHFIVEAGAGYPSAGFVILQGCRNPHRSIELKRIVLSAPAHGQGYGRAALRVLAQMAFRDLGAHRFWLDVKARNVAAQALYRSEGFVEEGRLRESVRTDDGYDSLVVMSMLAEEHAARAGSAASPLGSSGSSGSDGSDGWPGSPGSAESAGSSGSPTASAAPRAAFSTSQPT